MATKSFKERTFDARPDRVDLRDRVYQPKLIPLPPRYPADEYIEQYLAHYSESFVLDQGTEGACTGFGLAALINFVQWKGNRYQSDGLKTVSPRMLYHMARMYDEWPGEDYEGSSCRGAMKGWHRHGVCSDVFWPYRNKKDEIAFIPPKEGWESDASSRPLGAYYRVEHKSISDMQSAIFEVGAIYCSANVHKGWYLKTTKEPRLIPFDPKPVGGHAFALIGYTEDGFILQNSWGPAWGYHGFAILGYDDWVHNGNDAWVAVTGAPLRTSASPATFTTRSLQDSAAEPAGSSGGGKTSFKYRNQNVQPLNESEAYLHTVVLGNNGLPINRVLGAADAQQALKLICVQRPSLWLNELRANRPRKLAIYVHGGLNSESDSLLRVRVMAPYFLENGIYPLFVTWKTGPMESIAGILEDSTRAIFHGQPEMRDEGLKDKIKDALAEARDRSIEVACEKLLVKPMWSEMKQNALAAASSGSGLFQLAGHLLTLRKTIPNLEIHLAGHSAGSIVLGYLLSLMQKPLSVSSLTLFAPACTLEFANQHFGAALRRGALLAKNVHVDIMDNERELADSVGPYGKSLLYLVSRALESRHKMPLLGMEWAWKTPAPQDHWSNDPDAQTALQNWAASATRISLQLHGKQRKYVATGADRIPLAHGSFDNDVVVISAMLERMRGGSLLAKVENLKY